MTDRTDTSGTNSGHVREVSATERLRALLDERGVEHFDATECTLWGYEQTSDSTGCYRFAADEVGEGFMTLRMHHLTPEQAVDATLGETPTPPPPTMPKQPPYDLLIDLLRDVWGIDVSWDWLRRFWYVGWTDRHVDDLGRLHDELRDAIVEILGGRCDWDQTGVTHAHEVLERAATLGRGTCHAVFEVDAMSEDERIGEFVCSECGETLGDGRDQRPNYCPSCGAKVVW